MGYLVYGLGISGIACANFLTKTHKVSVYDDNKKLVKDLLDKKIIDCVALGKLNVQTLKSIDNIILSPTVRLSDRLLRIVHKLKINVWGEFEFASQFCVAPIFGVTGTNGKTTTVNFLHQIFLASNVKSHLVGNVGSAFSGEIDKIEANDKVVAELSSFQLENVSNLKLESASILNIAPDHMDRYTGFSQYSLAKENILKCLVNGKTWLNYDDKNLRLLGLNYAQSCFFSLKKLPNELEGVFIDDGFVYYKQGKQLDKLFSLDSFLIAGEHNKTNLLCAIGLAISAGLTSKQIETSLPLLKLPRHRLEFVKKVGSVSFYNDSKATNLHAVMAALKVFKERVVLLLGGSDKGEDLSNLTLPKNVELVITFGELGKKFYKALKGKVNIKSCEKLYDAVYSANKLAPPNSVVLLSPGGASFDEFSSYSERGEYFCELVNEIKV